MLLGLIEIIYFLNLFFLIDTLKKKIILIKKLYLQNIYI